MLPRPGESSTASPKPITSGDTAVSTRPAKRPRVSQRPPQACTHCVRGKRRCDKQQPCGQCVDRGLGPSCARESVVVKGRILGGAAGETTATSVAEVLTENAELRRQLGLGRGSAHETRSTAPSQAYPASEVVSRTDLEHARADLRTLGLRTAQSPDPRSPPESGCFFPSSPGPDEKPKGPSARHSNTRIPPDVRPGLPSRQLSDFLIDRALNVVGWLHVAVHPATFLKKHSSWQDERVANSDECYLGLSWLALYFALLSLGAFFVEDQDPRAVMAGLPPDHLAASRTWFDASLRALEASDYLRVHQGRAIQAIYVLLQVGNAFDESPLMATLLSCAMRTSQHVLGNLVPPEAQPTLPGLISRELSRRLREGLLAQEWLSPLSQHPGSLLVSFTRLSSSSHCNNRDLRVGTVLPDQPSASLADTSFHKFMFALATICQRFNTDFLAAGGEDRQAVVAGADAALLSLLDGHPVFGSAPEAYSSFDAASATSEDLLPWMRYKAHLTIRHRRALLYRLLLQEAGSAARMAREVCVKCARAVLGERRKPKPALFDRDWRVGFETATAGLSLLAAYQHLQARPKSGSRNDPDVARLRADLLDAICLLENDGRHNSIAGHAAAVLSRHLDGHVAGATGQDNCVRPAEPPAPLLDRGAAGDLSNVFEHTDTPASVEDDNFAFFRRFPELAVPGQGWSFDASQTLAWENFETLWNIADWAGSI